MPAAPHETVLCRYRYDPLDRLIDCAPSAEAGIQRFYCKSRLATEIQGAVQHSVFQHDDQLLAQLRREDLKADTTLLATDHQRSVLNALDATCLHPLAYTPYGHRPAENGLLSLLGFNGERPDPVTGHYLLGNGYRAFNTVLMRFNSPDSWSPFGEGGMNAYAYCTGNPINFKDPTGHTLIPPKLFDKFFEFTYQRLIDTSLRNHQFEEAVKATNKLFGGDEALHLLSREKTRAAPDAVTANVLASTTMQKKIVPLGRVSPEKSAISYLAKARPHIEQLLKKRNVTHNLLTTERYSKHLTPDEIRNLQVDLISTKNELRSITTHLLSIRQTGPSQSKLFKPHDFAEAATNIRSNEYLFTQNPGLWNHEGYP